MPVRKKKFEKVTGPVINDQGYNIANWLNVHADDYADERFVAYNGTIKVNGHRVRILSNINPIIKLDGCAKRYIAVINMCGIIEIDEGYIDILQVGGYEAEQLSDGRYIRKYGSYFDWYDIMSPSAMARHLRKKKFYTSAELIYMGLTTKCNMTDLLGFKTCIESCLSHGDSMYNVEELD